MLNMHQFKPFNNIKRLKDKFTKLDINLVSNFRFINY